MHCSQLKHGANDSAVFHYLYSPQVYNFYSDGINYDSERDPCTRTNIMSIISSE